MRLTNFCKGVFEFLIVLLYNDCTSKLLKKGNRKFPGLGGNEIYDISNNKVQATYLLQDLSVTCRMLTGKYKEQKRDFLTFWVYPNA